MSACPRSEPLEHGRWAEFEPLAPKLVVEVQYHHFSGGRFAMARNCSAGVLTGLSCNVRCRKWKAKAARRWGYLQLEFSGLRE